MQVLAVKDVRDGKIKDNFLLFGTGILLTLIINVLFFFSVISFQELIALAAGTATFFLLFSFEVTLRLFLISLFINLSVAYLYVPVVFVIPVVVSFIINFKNAEIKEFKSPLTVGILIYTLSIIPSYYNASNLKYSLFYSFNLVAMVLLHYVLVASIKKNDEIKKSLYFFIVLVFINGLIVNSLGIIDSGKRAYGIAGVVFVDYVSIAVISIIITYLFRREKILIYFGLIVFLILSLIFTQTRNVLVSLGLAMVSLFIYLFINSKKFNFKKATLLKTVGIFAFVCFVLFEIILFYKPESFNRIMETVDQANNSAANKNKLVVSSVTTRFFIWHTAYMAFKAHPVIGIGAFSFPVASVEYTKVPKEFFDEYVKGLSPHVTFLANLAETGIIGFAGFVFLLFYALKKGVQSIKLAKTPEEDHISVLLFFLQLYIAFSMFFTDAWLWGQCGMLWAFIMGLSAANNKLLSSKGNE